MAAPDAASGTSQPVLPVPQPAYILRGHASPVHALTFYQRNSRLVSGDADGFVVVWSVAIKRPLVVWRAHEASLLSIQPWGSDRLLTQGRDGKVYCWSWSSHDETAGGWSTKLPAEQSAGHRKAPWLLHSIEISTLNFCAFACCIPPSDSSEQVSLVVAVAGAKDSDVELYQLPDGELKGVITGAQSETGKPAGMAMALAVFYATNGLKVVAAYENGQTCVYERHESAATEAVATWRQIYSNTPHVQPVLSLVVSPTLDCYYSSAADGIIARHPLTDQVTFKQTQTFHSGQQGLSVRSDGRLFATAGWDSHGRIYSNRTLRDVAVLAWHKQACYSTAFANVDAAAPAKAEASALTSRQNNSMARAREQKAMTTHWLALGSKDGKISLWDIF